MNTNYTAFLPSNEHLNSGEKTLPGILDTVQMEVFPPPQTYLNLEARQKVHGFASTRSKKAVQIPLMLPPAHKDMSNWSSIIEQQEIFFTE